jgi:hypothetical protein
VLAYHRKELEIGVTHPIEDEAIPSFPRDPQEHDSSGRAKKGWPVLVVATKVVDHILE